MILALFSDLHANLHALQACMTHAKQCGATRFAFLGDYVGYGAQPKEVLELVMNAVAQGAIAVKGNHDLAAANPVKHVPTAQQTFMDASAHWTHEQLYPEHREFLLQLPMSATLGTCFFVHASADNPDRWHYVESEHMATLCLDAAVMDPSVRHVFCGHVHRQRLFYQGLGNRLMPFSPTPSVSIPVTPYRHWLATVGSVGQPRDGSPLAMYATLNTAIFRLTFHRVPYDHMAAAQAIHDAELPPFFAERLEHGR